MKLNVLSEKVNGLYLGFEFENGIAEIPKGEEQRAKSIAVQLNYKIVEDEKKEAPKKETVKKPATRKRTTKKEEDK